VPMSARTGTGIEALSAWVQPGRTVALLGSSGVGKSTLVNALAGDERQRTGEVRAEDSRGRHTTTWRELVCTPSGAVLIDTPGMRQFQLWGDGADVSSAFADVESLATECKFRDCSHEREPGCAVLAAVDSGGLERERYEAWRKLQRELRWLATRQDKRLAAAQQSKWKAISKSARSHPKYGR
jgi:ribosome biogenesis GTPase